MAILEDMERFDCLIIGSGPAGLGAALELSARKPKMRILMLDKGKTSSGGLRNDCKMNFTWPIGFPQEVWTESEALSYLGRVEDYLKPSIMEKQNLESYEKRAERVGARLLRVRQAHYGTDGGLELIHSLCAELESRGVKISLEEEALAVDSQARILKTDKRELSYENLIVAPGRGGFSFLQRLMDEEGISYVDNVIDIGIRVETRLERYPIVKDYYDPKILFPEKVRSFCTNSGFAQVVQEKYRSSEGKDYYSVNGHAFSTKRSPNGLVNFALLKSITLTEPVISGHRFAEMLGSQAAFIGGGHPIMQRVGDFRLGKRSTRDSFSGDLYDFEPTLASACPGDLSLAMPAKVLRAIWKALKSLDAIVPGILHPSTIMYYPELKLYANRPTYIDASFACKPGLYLAGDGAGTSRGISAAWASGLRVADGILGGMGST